MAFLSANLDSMRFAGGEGGRGSIFLAGSRDAKNLTGEDCYWGCILLGEQIVFYDSDR